MNERLKEFSDQAIEYAHANYIAGSDPHQWNVAYRKKFAELIAQDIADQFKHVFTDEQYQRRIDKEILKRYGIID